MIKYCKDCNKNKEITKFYSRKRSNGNIYHNIRCIECQKSKQKIWRDNNKERKKENDRKWRDNNKERKKENDRKWRDNNKERIKKWKKENRENIYEYNKIYRSNPNVKIIENQRSRLRNILKKEKYKNTIKFINSTPNFLKKWIEWQFNSNMNWDNYGSYWHIDHVIPCSTFSLKNEETYKIFEWKNLRPLEATKNISKNNKILLKDILIQELKVYIFMQQIQIAGIS